VKVKNWLNGVEGETLAGISASFGATFPTHAKESHRIRALSGSIALSLRGGCDFTTKAEIAQSGGARGLVVINDKEDLLAMGCPNNESTLNITIPVLMISKSGGEALNKSMVQGVGVELLLYSPIRPVVDYAVLLLWLMAVGTIVCASVWSAATASEQSDERYNELSPKVPFDYLFLFAFVFSHQESCNVGSVKEDVEKEFLDINARSAVVFVITASTFLVLLYLFMSSWFVWLLIVLFCIGGIEVLCYILVTFTYILPSHDCLWNAHLHSICDFQ
ncbi:hypothetical protein RJ639_031993, partial [Escallonia herrerae]